MTTGTAINPRPTTPPAVQRRSRHQAWLRRGAVALGLTSYARLAAQSDFHDGSADLAALTTAPPGFEVTVFAREPLVRQACSMAFDARGRLDIGAALHSGTSGQPSNPALLFDAFRITH